MSDEYSPKLRLMMGGDVTPEQRAVIEESKEASEIVAELRNDLRIANEAFLTLLGECADLKRQAEAVRPVVVAVVKLGPCERARYVLDGGPPDGGPGTCEWCDLATWAAANGG